MHAAAAIAMTAQELLTRFAPLLLLLTVILILLLAVVVWLMSSIMLRPVRMSDARALFILGRLSPRDLSLSYESLSFSVPGSATPGGPPLRIAAWWLPCPQKSERTAVILHGYADAKVGAIAWAPTWLSLGYNVLTPDARAHGETAGRYCTAGYYERHDLSNLVDQLRAARPAETAQIVLVGISLGAATALATAVLRDGRDIDAVVIDCPYADFRHACLNNAALMRLPLPTLQPLALRIAQHRARCNFDEMRPTELIPRMPVKLLAIQSGRDPLVPPDDIAALKRATEMLRARDHKSEFLLLPDAEHVLALRDSADYAARLERFLHQ